MHTHTDTTDIEHHPERAAALGDPGHEIDVDADRDAGITTIEILIWGALMIGVIVVIAGALQILGVDVINKLRTGLGV